MFKQNSRIKLNKNYILILFVSTGLFFQSCKTTQVVKEAFAPEAPEEATYVLSEDVVFPKIEGDYKYLFFRLYNPEYSNPLYIANILKNGLKITKTDDVPDLSHASINFTLDDNYYGLTLGGKHQLAEEECAVPLNNKYMKHCDPEKSEQITYALKVTAEEYENTKTFVERYAEGTDIKYASGLNFKIAFFSIGRKFFTSKEHQQFGTIIYPKSAKNKKVDIDNEDDYDNNFVCSTFVGYVLYNNVESTREFFDENDIKYEYLTVTDLSLIPGMTPLFYSTWASYPEAARAFVEEYPEFKEYLSN